jgi:hypothetical protein
MLPNPLPYRAVQWSTGTIGPFEQFRADAIAGDGEPGDDDCGKHFGSRKGCRTTDHRQWHTSGIRTDPLSRHVVLQRRPRSPAWDGMRGSAANRAVNALPYICAAAPGIHTTLDLPQVVTTLAREADSSKQRA